VPKILFLFLLGLLAFNSYSSDSRDSASKKPSYNLIHEKAKKIIGKWQHKALTHAEEPSLITASGKEISNDQKTLAQALHIRGLSVKEINKIEQIKFVLGLAEIRYFNNELETAKANFPHAFKNLTKESSEGNGGGKNAQWYKTSLLAFGKVLKGFEGFLSRHKTYSTNPPPFLVGIKETLEEGEKAYASYKQYADCFDSPEKTSCSILALDHDSQEHHNSGERNEEGHGYEEEDEEGIEEEDHSDTSSESSHRSGSSRSSHSSQGSERFHSSTQHSISRLTKENLTKLEKENA